MNRRGLLFLFFFLSGVAGLLYEVVWSRLLLLVFGGSTYATATVLASFMSGLALGSWLFGRRADRSKNPLRLYGRIEIGIAVAALLVPLFVLAGRALFLRIAPGLEESALFVPVRYAVAFLTLLLPTTLMGGTFPIMTRVVVRETEMVGRSVGLLYFLNTGGAVFGALAAAFLTLPAFGIYGSIGVGIALNLLVGIGVLALAGNAQAAEPPAETEPARPPGALVPHRPVLLLFALSGFASLGYEVAWVRVLVFFLGNNTIFAFSIMLATFLTGLALGGALYSLLFARFRRRLLLFGLLEIGIALAALLTLHLFGEVNRTILYFLRHFGMQSWVGLLGLRVIVCSMTMLLPTLLIGATFPAVVHAITDSVQRVGREVGAAYALNTVGAIFGSVAAGFLLIPAVGVEKTLLFLTAINIGVGAITLALAAGRYRFFGWATAVVLVVGAAMLPVAGGSGRFLQIYEDAVPGRELAYYKEGAGATVSVHTDAVRKTKLLCVNGVQEVPTDFGSLEVFKLLGHAGALIHPEPKEGLAIALGGGIALGALALHPLDHVTCVEICPEVKGGAALFADENNDVLDNEKVRILFNDGRNQLLLSDRLYDVIISDATHPGSADSWVLYTTEFYKLVLSRLGPEGVFCQWLPYHGVDTETYRTILRTFRSAFPRVALFALSRHSILIGSAEPITLDLETIAARVAKDPVRSDLASVGLADPVRIAAALSLQGETFDELAGPGRVNTDAWPKNSFAEAKGHNRFTQVQALAVARSRRPDPLLYCRRIESIGITPDSLRRAVAVVRDAWELEREAITLAKNGRRGEAERAWQEALRTDPENLGIAHLYAEHLLDTAISLAHQGSLESMIPLFRKMADLLPWSADPRFRLGNHLLRENRVIEAIIEYEAGLKIDPSNEAVRARLAGAKRKLQG